MTDFNKSLHLSPIYQRDKTGKVRIWSIEIGYDGDHSAAYRVHSGLFDGKVVVSTWKKALGKNIGKKNETSSLEQAHFEAASKYKEKLDEGYFRDIGQIDDARPFEPMLAVTYDKVNFERIVFSQPKLDGIRCIATRHGLFTRTGKKIVAVPHIWTAIASIFEKEPDLVLDGELYNHDLKDNFNKITSAVRKTKPSAEDLKECAEIIEYHLYDCVSPQVNDYMERMELLSTLVAYFGNQNILQVDTSPVTSQEDADALYADYIEEGFEGQMFRYNDAPYENKRSKNLIKRKEFLTDEFKVVSIEEGEGNWSGHIKTFKCVKEDGTEFGAGVRGNQATLKMLFEQKRAPDWATVRYFTPTPDGIPRFPVVVDWGYGERND